MVDEAGFEPVAWTIPPRVTPGLGLGILAVLVASSVLFALSKNGPVFALVVGGVLLVAGLGFYARFRNEETYRVDSDGLTVQVGDGDERFHAWNEFESFQTAEERNDSVPGLHGSGARPAGDQPRHGRVFTLTPRSSWRLPVSVWTSPEVENRVREALDEVLDHDPGQGLATGEWALGVSVTLIVIAGAVTTAILWA